MRHLAASINQQLCLLRKQCLRYLNGDRELKEAVTNISHDLRTPLTAICGYMDLENVHINAVLEESIAGFYGALTRQGIRPIIHITEKRIEHQLNKAALARIFSNILNNALKYSDGDLAITMEDDGEIIFSNAASGLNEVQVGKLFDRFYSVENARNSTGLGLSIAKFLTEQMNGSIRAEYDRPRFSIYVKF